MIDPQYDYAAIYDDVPDIGIGIVGAGEIVSAVHLPAYESAGFNVVGVFDRDADRTKRVAKDHGVRGYVDRDALLDDPAVGVVDIAVPPFVQRPIVEAAVERGNHVLCQKPLADTFTAAEAIAEAIATAGVVGAVNQQMRWEKSIRATKELLDGGAIGTPLRAHVDAQLDTAKTSWTGDAWQVDLPRLEVMQHSIHYLDAFRYLFGDPETVSATAARAPGQVPRAETRTIQTLTYDGDLRATIDADHTSWAENRVGFHFEGTDGRVSGSFGFPADYPNGGTDTLEFRSRDGGRESWSIPDAWFPDAFIGTMGSLLRAIDTGERPPTHPDDNLDTLRLTNAIYRSVAEDRGVDPATVDGDHYPPFVDPTG